MATPFSGSSKFCCTCAYWQGERKVMPVKQVYVPQATTKGMCSKNRKEFNASFPANGCSKYFKWQNL